MNVSERYMLQRRSKTEATDKSLFSFFLRICSLPGLRYDVPGRRNFSTSSNVQQMFACFFFVKEKEKKKETKNKGPWTSDT